MKAPSRLYYFAWVVPFVVGLYTCSYLVSPEETSYPLPEIKTSSGTRAGSSGGDE